MMKINECKLFRLKIQNNESDKKAPLQKKKKNTVNTG